MRDAAQRHLLPGQTRTCGTIIFIYPMSLLIVHVAKAWIFQSFGFAIMIVTVGVRMLLMPLNVMQYKNQLNMKRLQPQLKELKKVLI
ncbi:hypothetical protein GCM10020331_036620 [Ectobacillus funiculus]